MKICIFFIALLSSGCSTIHFKNGTDVAVNSETEKWHHNVALALFEVSEPVNLQQECADRDWSTVTTELTFLNGLASGAVNLVAPIWYPKTVSVSCQ
ncbi:hypothetical protein VT06_01915 [Arsukibacterium sp. MJ3]|uniref:Bor/Iss family lipoprotein n=1 Tax=Arsukibacterium sp. MJ3 TaxID=1632859 RepID=UPI000626F8F5|nr:hypothetical protein [Arsukibacterium sp. MJ3]KKO50401.1 hypothetical protein VT06_01915 [Arsukibacterium sp. MJ3]